ncbi:dehydrodolichyl diphosphate syntase complex subunit NUS1-like isoform X1 [Chlorella sorokiniana]|uniref:ditrans,polycis-polyprenyl diphosphate synthase [(2E,6E)-farnesyldiphosphate specific] n=1 Tax=Chlorella sorokiniana TaxID=3076 RepID=A0A2P6TB38_CHLSO|nr:dehydrodolichyl diphosphate syntase complex subunit NUS1-like isoform X1 [Chlorella sorokiniana]|eukprot:PRW05752.1 dehydrodolichyl diphosphate syntase complex subunit NUS1-like isoform X1 [Chlorella sorokiniana]
MLLSDLLLPALWALARGLLALVVRAHSLLRGLGTTCSAAAARTAVAAPALRPLLATLFALPPREHIGSRPRPPTILGVAVAEEVQDGDWPAAIEALGRLLAWARSRGFALVLLYEPSGTLQQPHRLRQLELKLLLQRLQGLVTLQTGWQPGRKAAQPEQQQPQPQHPPADGGMMALLLSAADGQWPLLEAATAAAKSAGSSDGQQQQQEEDVARTNGHSAAAAAQDAAFAAPARLRVRLQAVGGPLAGAEPDFVLVTGPTLTLAGFPAWLVRSSEIYGVGPVAQLAAEPLDTAMQRYCRTKQRFGK